MVEEDNGGAYTQFQYSPTGFKMMLIDDNDPSGDNAFVPLPAGDTALWIYGLAGPNILHGDWLGSSRMISTPSRTVYYDGAYAPFGESYAESGTTDRNFTGMDQGIVSGLYDFPAREYNSLEDRWPSPDPAGIASVNPADPQTWNRYAYVRNSPLMMTDPLGLVDGVVGSAGTTTVYVYGDDGCDPSTNIFCEAEFYMSELLAEVSPFLSALNININIPGGGGGGGGTGSTQQPQTTSCTVSNGRTTAPGPGQAPGPGAFGLYPSQHPGMVAIDPMALGLFPGFRPTPYCGRTCRRSLLALARVPTYRQASLQCSRWET